MADKEKTLLEVLNEADAGDIDAMRRAIAMLEVQGYDKEKDVDIVERIFEYKKALVDSEEPAGYIMLAYEYLNGINVPKDVEKAIELYEIAASKGEDFGNQCLGMLYYEGVHVPPDYKKAMDYFGKTSAHKSACTYYAMGEMYRLGLGVDQDIEKSFKSYLEIFKDDSPSIKLDDYYPRAIFRIVQFYRSFEDGEWAQRAYELFLQVKDRLLDKGRDSLPTDIPESEVLEEWESLNADFQYVPEGYCYKGAYSLFIDEPMTKNQFDDIVVDIITDLEVKKDRANDFLVVNFNYEQGGNVVFVQAAIDSKDDNYDLEIARYEDDLPESETAYEDNEGRKYKLYGHEPRRDTDARVVIETLRKIMVDDGIPDLSLWSDITEECIEAAE